MKCLVEAFWDEEVKVWVASSEDVPGLATEAENLDLLTKKLKAMIPELLIANDVIPDNYVGQIDFELITRRHTANAVLKQAGLAKAF